MKPVKTYTKESLIEEIEEIRNRGWILGARPGNDGSVGNTLEDLLGIEENNLPIPNASEWELKTQKKKSTSLVTLFSSRPSPQAMKLVPRILLPNYGWPHKEAGNKYPREEKSFRQTINGLKRTNRGFGFHVDRKEQKIEVSFDSNSVDKKEHGEWLKSVEERIDLGDLSPRPYWGFSDLFYLAGTKIKNCFYVRAERKRIDGKEHFHYQEIKILTKFSLDKFISAFETGIIYVEFDARTGHDHGTDFRINRHNFPKLYESVIDI